MPSDKYAKLISSTSNLYTPKWCPKTIMNNPAMRIAWVLLNFDYRSAKNNNPLLKKGSGL
jgi:hypothetical protein